MPTTLSPEPPQSTSSLWAQALLYCTLASVGGLTVGFVLGRDSVAPVLAEPEVGQETLLEDAPPVTKAPKRMVVGPVEILSGPYQPVTRPAQTATARQQPRSPNGLLNEIDLRRGNGLGRSRSS